MGSYLGEVGKRMTLEVTLVGEYEFASYYGYRPQTTYIYKFKDDEDNVLVWKTTAIMSVAEDNDRCYFIRKGDRIQITATVKDHSEYKGEAQTTIQRAKYEVIKKGKTYEEYRNEKQTAQKNTLTGKDFIWSRMPYKQYKKHYSDCETLYGSFVRDDYTGESFIDVIIREGRLKASGVRGEVFSEYTVVSDSGFFVTYKAVCEENAIRRAEKEYPNETGWFCEDHTDKTPYEPWGSHSFWSN